MTNTPVDLYEQAVDKLERWQLDEAEELLRQLLDADSRARQSREQARSGLR